MAIMPQSVAIGMRAVGTMKRHSQINLRQDEFAFVQNYESILKSSSIAFKVIAVVLLILCVSYGMKFFFYQRQIDVLQAQYLKEYTTAFPAAKSQYVKDKFTFTKLRNDATQKLQKEVTTKRNAVSSFLDENLASPALITLKALSETIPKDVKVDITTYQYTTVVTGGGKLIIRGEADGYAASTAVLEAIKLSPEVSILLDDKIEKMFIDQVILPKLSTPGSESEELPNMDELLGAWLNNMGLKDKADIHFKGTSGDL